MLFFLDRTFRTQNTRKTIAGILYVRIGDRRRVLGDRESMDNDSSLPTKLVLTELATCTRAEDTGRYTLPDILYPV